MCEVVGDVNVETAANEQFKRRRVFGPMIACSNRIRNNMGTCTHEPHVPWLDNEVGVLAILLGVIEELDELVNEVEVKMCERACSYVIRLWSEPV